MQRHAAAFAMPDLAVDELLPNHYVFNRRDWVQRHAACVTLHKNGTIIFNNLYLDRKEIL